VFQLATGALRLRPGWRGEIAAGPFGDAGSIRESVRSLNGRIKLRGGMSDCRAMFARASAVVQMAGYNSTFEALAAGHRSVLVPRVYPRREQAIRAERLATLGLADVVHPAARPEDLAQLLDRPRRGPPTTHARSVIDLNGADRAATVIRRLARVVIAA